MSYKIKFLLSSIAYNGLLIYLLATPEFVIVSAATIIYIMFFSACVLEDK